jgi:hypothetical protein
MNDILTTGELLSEPLQGIHEKFMALHQPVRDAKDNNNGMITMAAQQQDDEQVAQIMIQSGSEAMLFNMVCIAVEQDPLFARCVVALFNELDAGRVTFHPDALPENPTAPADPTNES